MSLCASKSIDQTITGSLHKTILWSCWCTFICLLFSFQCIKMRFTNQAHIAQIQQSDWLEEQTKADVTNEIPTSQIQSDMNSQNHQPFPMLINGDEEFVAFPKTTKPLSNASIDTEIISFRSENPIKTTCPYCYKKISTDIRFLWGRGSCVWSIVLGVPLFWICACCWPLWCKSMQDVEHVCPQCHRTIGFYQRL